MRYIAEYIGPKTGQVTLGTFNKVIGNYQSDKNARRYLCQALKANRYPAGQYELSRWPDGSSDTIKIGMLYKMA